MARLDGRIAGDNRPDGAILEAERELKIPPDPTLPAPLKLEDLLVLDAQWWPQKFDHLLCATLGKAARRPEPVVAPEPAALRSLIWSARTSFSGDAINPAEWYRWRELFGTGAETILARVHGLWKIVSDTRRPAPAQHELLVNLLAERIVAAFNVAAEAQVARLAKQAERNGPVARAQAAAAVLEHLAPMQQALLAFGAAMADNAGPPEVVRHAALSLQKIEALAKGALQ